MSKHIEKQCDLKIKRFEKELSKTKINSSITKIGKDNLLFKVNG